MNVPHEHVDERLDEWLDGRLEVSLAESVEAHLAECERCRRLASALRATRDLVRAAVPDEPLPDGLRGRIETALDELDREADHASDRERTTRLARGSRRSRRDHRGTWRWLAAAATVTLAVGVTWLATRQAPTLPDPVPVPPAAPFDTVPFDMIQAIHRASTAVQGPELPSSVAAASAKVIEDRWRDAGIDFPVRVLDLAAMGVDVVGGDAAAVAGRRMARSIYRSADDVLVCWMFRARLAVLPEPSEVREHGGFRFQLYRRGGETLVFWQEGEVVCGLVGSGDPESVIALAFAKAMAVPFQT